MRTDTYLRTSRVAVSADEVYRWHLRPGAFERLTPPWEPVEVVDRSGEVSEGSTVTLRLRVGPVSRTWVAEHRDLEPGRRFVDVQTRGPFARWEHSHRFESEGPGSSILEDRIDYALPLGAAGRFLGGPFVRRKLERMFAYRHRVTAGDLEAHGRFAEAGASSRRVALTGASGLVGSALAAYLSTGGHRVVRLVRRDPDPGAAEIGWDPASGRIDRAGLEGLDAVVHLAGENIASGRWNEARKRRIRESRVRGTRLLAEALASLERPPRVLVSASAIGFYGDRGDERLLEESASGTGFLPEVCREWEAATGAAEDRGVRVVHLRIGIVLSPAGGALRAMLLPFRLGLGGKIGSGRQFLSWISLDDLVGAIHHSIETESLRGAVNAVAPHPVTNGEFTRTLGRVLRRPTVLRVPAFAARLALGEMAQDLLLASMHAEPGRLAATGYRFRDPDLEGALRHLLGRPLSRAPSTIHR
jgi:hypothetical protein